MDGRKKMVELLTEYFGVDPAYYGIEAAHIADHLIAHGVTVHEWVSVKERLPQEKVDCIVHYKHAYCDNDDYWEIGICFYDGEKFQMNLSYKVTHWMPLPKPPKGE